MNDKFYIKKIVRDDGTAFEFDQQEIFLDADNTLLVRPDPDTTAVNYTEADGGELISQKNPAHDQTIAGLIIPKTTQYWALASRVAGFFQINHTYKIVYIKKSGEMFAVAPVWISGGLQMPPQPREDYSRWSVTFTIGNAAWREYSEDAGGQETYANIVRLPLLAAAQGGEKWDDVGLVVDGIGEVWTDGEGGVQSVIINSVSTIYPVWVVRGECVRPTLQNNTTDTLAVYNGTVAAGQTLVVDFEAGTAHLDGALVTRNITGLVSCVPGENVMGFNSDGGNTESSEIKWNNVIG